MAASCERARRRTSCGLGRRRLVLGAASRGGGILRRLRLAAAASCGGGGRRRVGGTAAGGGVLRRRGERSGGHWAAGVAAASRVARRWVWHDGVLRLRRRCLAAASAAYGVDAGAAAARAAVGRTERAKLSSSLSARASLAVDRGLGRVPALGLRVLGRARRWPSAAGLASYTSAPPSGARPRSALAFGRGLGLVHQRSAFRCSAPLGADRRPRAWPRTPARPDWSLVQGGRGAGADERGAPRERGAGAGAGAGAARAGAPA
jgi:hypothetical protein